MSEGTLYGVDNIHGLTYIICGKIHSCVTEHYMACHTFMVVRTLYA